MGQMHGVSLWVFLVFFCSRVLAQFEDASNSSCEGVLMNYQVDKVTMIPPFLASNSSQQPYSFASTLTLTNMGFNEVKNWEAFVGFQHNEWLVSAPGTILADGKQLPTPVVNGATFSGFPQTDLLNAVETAGDTSKTQVAIKLTGTEFGVAPPNAPLPKNISLVMDGYSCGKLRQNGSNMLQICCNENATAVNLTAPPERFLPLQQGDITISYSVIQAFVNNYWAEVTISNDNLLGRIDGWNLTWDWKQGEFIGDMRGAEVVDQDQSDCFSGPAAAFYKELDFSTVQSCKPSPTISDLPIYKTNDTKVGLIPFCCRSGLLLPKLMDPTQSKSVFRLFVNKVPPNLARDQLSPPANFRIGPDYVCGQPRLILPVEFPDPSSSLRQLSAVKSWQVTCNLTRVGGGNANAVVPPAKCCVSFSAFYNASVIPCPTCSCGCPTSSSRCSRQADALLIPSKALLVPFDNRTQMTAQWAAQNEKQLPQVIPCSDNCGVNINWHILSDFSDGWSARISILNWGDVIPEWFAAVEIDKAFKGFEKVYSFNYTVVPGFNSTIYMAGIHQFNDYLVGVNDKFNPGKQQSIISFKKKFTPKLNITAGDGFPTRVIFNGHDCLLPQTFPLPSSSLRLTSSTSTFTFFFLFTFFLLFFC